MKLGIPYKYTTLNTIKEFKKKNAPTYLLDVDAFFVVYIIFVIYQKTVLASFSSMSRDNYR